MALTQDNPAPYAPTNAILTLLERSRTKGLPATIDKDVLLRMGISESLAPRTLQALHILDLITEDGGHTAFLEGLRIAPEAEYKIKMAEWLNSAYADILQYADPAEGDESSVRDAFRPYKPHSMQDRMLTLFTGLYGAAGIWPDSAQRARVDRAKPNIVRPERKKRTTVDIASPAFVPKQPQSPTALQPTQDLTEKALEYRLVDLMSEAVGNEEVMKSIINVITFLKTKGSEKSSSSITASGKTGVL